MRVSRHPGRSCACCSDIATVGYSIADALKFQTLSQPRLVKINVYDKRLPPYNILPKFFMILLGAWISFIVDFILLLRYRSQ